MGDEFEFNALESQGYPQPDCCHRKPNLEDPIVPVAKSDVADTATVPRVDRVAASLATPGEPAGHYPKSSWPFGETLLHAIYDEPDADSAFRPMRTILNAPSDKLPKVADYRQERRG